MDSTCLLIYPIACRAIDDDMTTQKSTNCKIKAMETTCLLIYPARYTPVNYSVIYQLFILE
jgi:hypothetical protein